MYDPLIGVPEKTSKLIRFINSNQFPPEKILSLPNLLTVLESMDVTVFLLLSSTSSKCIDNVKRIVQSNENFTKKIIVCSSSAFAIYQVRDSRDFHIFVSDTCTFINFNKLVFAVDDQIFDPRKKFVNFRCVSHVQTWFVAYGSIEHRNWKISTFYDRRQSSCPYIQPFFKVFWHRSSALASCSSIKTISMSKLKRWISTQSHNINLHSFL